MTFGSYFMLNKLTVRAFFFNAKTDYLPYYKNFTLSLEDNACAKDILIAIQAQNDMFCFPKKNLVFKINDLVIEEDTLLKNIVQKFGKNLQIDPVNQYRANNGLIINDDDFMKSFELLAPYSTESDKKYYKTLYALHYASETEKFDHSYVGDAILVLAHKMISEGSEHKTEILSAIASPSSGLLDCEYENNLFVPQYHESAIKALKNMLKNDENKHPSLLDIIKIRFGIQDNKHTHKKVVNNIPQTIDDLLNKQVAYYPEKCYSTVALEQLKKNKISMVIFDRMHKLSGVNLIKHNKTLAFKKAGTILLEAFDAGAEILIVENNLSYEMMKNNFNAIENIVGRKMLGFELITAEDLTRQLEKIGS